MMKQGDRWIVFYTDGSIFTSADGSPWDAPRRSVQSIASVKDSGDDWYNINMSDFFYFEEWTSDGQPVGGWHCAKNMFDVMDHLLRAKHPCVLFGRMLSDAAWKALHHEMNDYCYKHRAWLLGQTDEKPEGHYR